MPCTFSAPWIRRSAGTPVLPDVSPGAKLPECLRTVLRGRTIHDVGALTAVRR